MHWKPGKTTVPLDSPARAARPSRIRREPVAINANVPARRERPHNFRERDIIFGVTGIIVFALAIAAGTLGFSIFTAVHDDPADAAAAAQFSQCYNAQGANCVLDGSTIYMAGQRVDIGGMEVPSIANARCQTEHDRGVEAAVGLVELLNSGQVTLGATMRDISGRAGRKVEVDGADVASKMIGRGLAREPGSGSGWCS